MEETRQKMSVRAKRILVIVIIALGVLFCAAAWYVGDYYHADETALAIMADVEADSDGVAVRELSDKAIAFVPDEPTAGLIFYPGAKVQPEAYAPLAQKCAERGILFVIVRPLFNLALLDEGAADGVVAQFPAVDAWAVGGHSMGGVAAGDYVSRHEADFTAIVFLASYAAVDLTAFGGKSLSVVGSNDAVLNWDSYGNARTSLPTGAQEVIIDGGIHAYFGDYGEQEGDGVASITRAEQQERTADAIEAIIPG